MPEGHTIHRLARDHRRDFVGQNLQVSSPQGRFEVEARKLNRDRLLDTDAWGKHLFYHWKSGHIVHATWDCTVSSANTSRLRPPLTEPSACVSLVTGKPLT